MTKEDYLLILSMYQYKTGESRFELYRNAAKCYREGKESSIPPFELDNPFVTKEDIKRLKESKDPEIIDYYARSMMQIVSSYKSTVTREEVKTTVEEVMEPTLSRDMIKSMIEEEVEKVSREEIKEVLEEKIEEKKPRIVITSISNKLVNELNGFAVMKEEKTGRIQLYYHDAKTSTLRAKTEMSKEQIQADTGYYVNFEEYIDKMLEEISQQYTDMESITFVREDGIEKDLNEVLEEAFAILRKRGSLRFGKTMSGKELENFKDLVMIKKEKENYNGESLTSGIYVRRDLLTRFFAKYQVKCVIGNEKNSSK